MFPTLRAILVLGSIACLPGCGRGDPAKIWEEARSAFDARDWAKTEASLARLAKLREPKAEDRMLSAQVLIARERPSEAIAMLGNVPDDHRMASTARLQIGQLELRRSRARVAEEELLRAVAINPREVQARRELIYLYGMQSRWKPMGEQFRALAETGPLGFSDVVLWCLSRNMSWDPDELRADLSRFLAADPDDRHSRLALVENLRVRQFLDDAEAALKPLPADDPDARAARVKIALDRGEMTEAEALLGNAPPGHPDLEKLRAKLALYRHDSTSALAHYRRAYDADPDNRDAIAGLGSTLALVGKKDEAAPFLKKARDYDAIASIIERLASTKRLDDPRLPLTLGAAYENVGRKPEARAWFGLAIARDPLDAEAQQALFRLKDPSDPAKSG